MTCTLPSILVPNHFCSFRRPHPPTLRSSTVPQNITMAAGVSMKAQLNPIECHKLPSTMNVLLLHGIMTRCILLDFPLSSASIQANSIPNSEAQPLRLTGKQLPAISASVAKLSPLSKLSRSVTMTHVVGFKCFPSSRPRSTSLTTVRF